jgi:PIN domain nuclease of toxin-antitoxin system
VSSPVRLEAHQQRALATPENQVFVSSVTVWEIAIKRALGRLVFPIDQFDDVAGRMGFDILPIFPGHAIQAGSLPLHHGDPFDRMLIAQAIVENLILVTSDSTIARYDVRILAPSDMKPPSRTGR